MRSKNTLLSYKIFFTAIGIFCLVAIGVNLAVRQGPLRDAHSEEDLRNISVGIEGFYAQELQLPTNLSELKSLPKGTSQRLKAYNYRPTDSSKYQLCATFLRPSNQLNTGYTDPFGQPNPSVHGVGYECFTYRADANSSAKPMPVMR